MTTLELRHSLRLMRKQPFLAITVILALATGIAVAATAFTFLSAVLWGELPFPRGDRFVRVRAYAEPEGTRADVALDRYHYLRERATDFAYLGAFRNGRVNILYASGEVESLVATRLTPGWFRFASYRPVAGRMLRDEDGATGASPVVVIRESLWARQCGSRSTTDPSAARATRGSPG